MNETQAQEEICHIGRSPFDCSHVPAITGRISVRLDDGFLTKPTDACLGFLNPPRLARLDAQGQQTGGDRDLACLPSRDAEFNESIAKGIDHALALDCPRMHSMAGRIGCGCRPERCSELGGTLTGLGWLRAWRQRA